MKVLIVGGSGLLGSKLYDILKENNYDVYASFLNNTISVKNSFRMDIVREEEVSRVIKKIDPDFVVHSAAFINVDECEKNKERAHNINVVGTENVANATEKIGSKLVYISTDYVFDGNKGFYKEIDKVNPINYYGLTKLKGEDVVKNICKDFVIARTSVIYGSSKVNFALWIIDQLEKGNQINVVVDQFVTPTLNIDLGEQLVSLIDNDSRGIFHAAGGERISRYDFAMVLADIFNLDKELINSVSMDSFDWYAKRPLDSSLDVAKISNIKKPYKLKDAVRLLQEDIRKVV